MPKNVLVNGACGRMGLEVVRTVVNETKDILVGAFDKKNVGKNIKQIAGIESEGEKVIIEDDLKDIIQAKNPDVIIDFTSPKVVMDNIKIGLNHGVNMIVGTTGITDTDLNDIKKMTEENNVNALIVPNFAIGAVLLMQFSREAAKYFKDVEIIELHHDQKVDAPSGTSIKTAELIKENIDKNEDQKDKEYIEKIDGVWGGDKDGVHIHSVRLPGLIAHQEVIFGGEGQSLTLRHDSYDRKSFMPGVKLALDKIDSLGGLVYGLEEIME
ncbi:MAG: 4-hydroxy-tetrahydrodipicolinate reductase [Halanaerobiaceae bacterium]